MDGYDGCRDVGSSGSHRSAVSETSSIFHSEWFFSEGRVLGAEAGVSPAAEGVVGVHGGDHDDRSSAAIDVALGSEERQSGVGGVSAGV